MLLAGDIGGTKTNLAVFSTNDGPRAPLQMARFVSADYDSLAALVTDFLDQADFKIERASFGVAGPVVEGKAELTNLPWELDETKLQAELAVPKAHLLNDLVAIANAVPLLGEKPGDVYTLHQGRPDEDGTKVIIAPGTGLGEAFLTWDGSQYRPYPSEGGHADFAPTDALQIDLLRYLQQRFGHVSYERICSGRGLPNIYAFLKESGYANEPAWLVEKLAAANDPAPVIVEAALDQQRECVLCQATLDTFVSILATEAGNMALNVWATGGVYLGGGIPPRILPALTNGRFMTAFLRKGRFSDDLERLPIYVILNPNVALLGAANYGLERLRDP